MPRDLVRPLSLSLARDGDAESKLDEPVHSAPVNLFTTAVTAIAASGANIAPGCFLWECIAPAASDAVPRVSASYVRFHSAWLATNGVRGVV